MNEENYTRAFLKEESRFKEIFPDGIVDIFSTIPVQPEVDAPYCYIVNWKKLSEQQKDSLANMLSEFWHIEKATALAYMKKKGIFLTCDHFTGVETNNIRQIYWNNEEE